MSTKTLSLKGVQTHILSFEEKSQEKTLIMLHGWGGSTESFRSLGEKIFSQEKMNVIIPDLPGFGKSETPDNWDTHEYEIWLEDLIQTLPKSQEFFFYGHSFGCRVILRYLAKHPEYKNKAILTGAAGIKFPPSFRQRVTTILKNFLGKSKNFFPEKFKHLILKKIFRANDWAACPETLKSTFQNVLAEEDLRKEAEKIRTQILLIWGKNDTYTPLKAGYIYKKILRNSELIVLKNGRHGIHYTHEKEILRHIHTFLKNS